MLKIFLVIQVLLFSASLNAQNFQLKGKVLEDSEILSGATIIVKLNDTIVSATLSNGNGEFIIENLNRENYNIYVSFLGYKTQEQSIEITKNSYIEFIFKEIDNINLDEVVIESDRSNIVSSSPIGSIFYLSSRAKQSKSIYDALQEIPKLNIDMTNRSISFNDGSAPLILINGSFRKENSLASIDPQNIESIEVIENAKAKYLVDGTNSVLNIKLKKNIDSYKYLNIGAKHNPELIYGFSDLSFETGNAKSSVYFTGQHFYFYKNRSNQYNKQITSLIEKSLYANRNINYGSYNLALGGDWNISSNNYLSYSITFGSIPESYKIKGMGVIDNLDSDQDRLYNYSKSYKKSFYLNTNNIYYKHTFTPNSEIEALFRVNLNKGKNSGLQIEKDQSSEDYYYNKDFDFKNERVSGSFDLDYSTNIGNGHKFSIGSRTEFQSNKINQKTLNIPTFTYKEWIEYLYTDYSKSWNEKFSHLLSVGMNIINNKSDNIKNHYYDIKYSISLGYKINTSHRFRFNITHYTVSPSVALFNPYNTSTDSLQTIVGNPFLEPYDIDNLNLSYSYNRNQILIEPRISYKKISNYISMDGDLINGGYQQSPKNNSKMSEYEFGATLRYTFKQIGFISLNTSYNRILFKKDIKDRNLIKGSLNFNFYYKKFSISGYGGLPIYTYDEIIKTRSSSESEITFLWRVNNNWDLTLGSRYITGRKVYEEWVESPDYNSYYSNRFKSRNFIVLLGFRYNFRNKSKSNRVQKRLNQEDMGIELIKTK
ncbi:MAG: TonB-dependent receptor [Dysgonomonas sp.]